MGDGMIYASDKDIANAENERVRRCRIGNVGVKLKCSKDVSVVVYNPSFHDGSAADVPLPLSMGLIDSMGVITTRRQAIRQRHAEFASGGKVSMSDYAKYTSPIIGDFRMSHNALWFDW